MAFFRECSNRVGCAASQHQNTDENRNESRHPASPGYPPSMGHDFVRVANRPNHPIPHLAVAGCSISVRTAWVGSATKHKTHDAGRKTLQPPAAISTTSSRIPMTPKSRLP